MAKQYRKFDEDFRQGAVQLVVETGKPITQVARVWASTRARWVTGAPRSVGRGRRTGRWIWMSGPSWSGCARM